MTQSELVVCCCTALVKAGTNEKELPTAIENWLSSNIWAGELFIKNECDFRYFVLDVIGNFSRTQKGKGAKKEQMHGRTTTARPRK